MERQPRSSLFVDFAKLLHEAQGGSKDAKDQLYLPYQALFCQWANRALGRQLRPECDSDFVLGNFAVAWESFEQFKGETEEEFTAWLKKIFENELNKIFRFRHRKKRDISRTVPLEGVPERNLTEEAETPLEHVIAKEEMRLLDQALDHLPKEALSSLFLHFNCGMTYEQMSHVLCCSADAARKRCERAITDLSHHLPAG
jgi:RNA polymerase sigma-70 factor (ECF subfamily)